MVRTLSRKPSVPDTVTTSDAVSRQSNTTSSPATNRVVRLIPRTHPEAARGAGEVIAGLARLNAEEQAALSDQLSAFMARHGVEITRS